MKKFLLIASILTLATSAFASPSGGEASATGVLDAGEVDEYRVVLRGDEDWRLLARGFGEDGDLDCAVYDANGNMVGSDLDNTNTCLIEGNPKWTGRFVVRLKNNGTEKIAYSVKID